MIGKEGEGSIEKGDTRAYIMQRWAAANISDFLKPQSGNAEKRGRNVLKIGKDLVLLSFENTS